MEDSRLADASDIGAQRTGASLAGKTAFVTGAASGIGRATALLLRSEGARTIVVDRDAEGLAALTGEGVHTITADLANGAAVVAAAAEGIGLGWGVDMLVN